MLQVDYRFTMAMTWRIQALFRRRPWSRGAQSFAPTCLNLSPRLANVIGDTHATFKVWEGGKESLPLTLAAEIALGSDWHSQIWDQQVWNF